MNIKALFSSKKTVSDAVADIKEQLKDFDVKMLIYFASWEQYSPDEISAGMENAFHGAVVYGCSSHAELYKGKTTFNTLTAMAFNSEVIDGVKVEIIENISGDFDVRPAFDAFGEYFGEKMSAADYKIYGGIVLIDGLSAREEIVMDKIGVCSDIIFIGGTASDNFSFTNKTYAYAGGKAYSDAALIAVFKTKKGVDFIKTQSVDVSDIQMTITKTCNNDRTILEIDGKPAAARYAELLGIPRSELENTLFENPAGLIIDSDVYIRSCPKTDGDKMYFYCSVLEDADMRLLKIRDIIPDTLSAVNKKISELGNISGLIDFRCAFRTVQLERDKTLDAYADIFSGIESIGFSTYGEQCYGHINQTSTMLVFR